MKCLYLIVGACIARPLTGNIFFLSKIGVIGTLAFAGDREGLPYNCKGRVGGIGNVCPLRHGINAVPPPPVACATVEALNCITKNASEKNGSVFYIACEANLATA